MPTTLIPPTIALQQPPAELVAFVEQEIREARPYKGLERRSEKRRLVAMPVLVQPVGEQFNVIALPFVAVTRDISPSGIGLVHTEPIAHGMVALRLSFETREVDLVAAVLRSSAFGPFHYAGANFLIKFAEFPRQVMRE